MYTSCVIHASNTARPGYRSSMCPTSHRHPIGVNYPPRLRTELNPSVSLVLSSIQRLSNLAHIRSERTGLPVETLLPWAVLVQDLLPVVFVVDSRSALQWLSEFWQLVVSLRKQCHQHAFSLAKVLGCFVLKSSVLLCYFGV